jgi:DNA polymerase III gamma/tau subunit
MSQQLINKYRPSSLDDVVGQAAVVKSLQSVLTNKKRAAQSFLFVGPSGCGKTTLARIIASMRDVHPHNCVEIDAATYTGVNDMRNIKESIEAPSMVGGPNKALIVDECHKLSSSAWDSMLKVLEEPPAHLMIALCTTEASKVPKTIRTRCHAYTLEQIRASSLVALLERVVRLEDLPVSDDVIDYLSRNSDNSARQALVNLSMVQHCKNLKAVKRVLAEADEGGEDVIKLCRTLVSGKTNWQECCEILKRMDSINPESVRIVVTRYVSKVVMNQKKPQPHLLAILEAFSEPCNASDGPAPLLRSFADLFYG